MELDYVNLRKEGYTEGSRIPSMMVGSQTSSSSKSRADPSFSSFLQEFGTPLDDALRRDITINSLFYNVHTRKVEDWTEKVRRPLFLSTPNLPSLPLLGSILPESDSMSAFDYYRVSPTWKKGSSELLSLLVQPSTTTLFESSDAFGSLLDTDSPSIRISSRQSRTRISRSP